MVLVDEADGIIRLKQTKVHFSPFAFKIFYVKTALLVILSETHFKTVHGISVAIVNPVVLFSYEVLNVLEIFDNFVRSFNLSS